MGQPNSKKCEFLALSAFSLLVILIIHSTIPKHLLIMNYDEAGYAFLCSKIAIDISTLDLWHFLFDTAITFDGFVPTYVGGLFLAIFGLTEDAARLSILFCFGLCIIAAYYMGKDITDGKKWGGILPVFFIVTSPGLLLYSTMIMKATMLAAENLLAMLFFWKAMETNKTSYFLLTALAVSTAFFTKYHYGVMLYITILTVLYVTNRNNLSALRCKNYLYLLALPILLLAIFLSVPFPGKLLHFIAAFTNTDVSLEGYSEMRRLFYYPLLFPSYYTYSYLPALLVLVSFVVSLKYLNNYKVLSLVVLLSINLLLNTYHPYKLGRFLLPAVPLLFVLVPFALTKLPEMLNLNRFATNKPIVAVCALLFILPVYTIPAKISKEIIVECWNVSSSEGGEAILDYFVENVDPFKPYILTGRTTHFGPEHINFKFAAHYKNRSFNRPIFLLHHSKAGPLGTLGLEYLDDYKTTVLDKLNDVDTISTVYIADDSQFYNAVYHRYEEYSRNYCRALEELRSEGKVELVGRIEADGMEVKTYKPVLKSISTK